MTAKGICIVGAGISGLTLVLRLQQLSLDVTLYTESSADEMRRGRLPSTVAQMKSTRARKRTLGSEQFAAAGSLVDAAKISIKGEPPLEFRGILDSPFHAIDFRLLIPGGPLRQPVQRSGHRLGRVLRPGARRRPAGLRRAGPGAVGAVDLPSRKRGKEPEEGLQPVTGS
ncbi:hypothetical protein OHA77_38185 [Streptosporangium sp. NBC_01639]|uniref:hypothetical protein n=1 Tax=Streptosporangium sp. NBC_01639 TaxID=2975948 RepID=UPI0038703C8D|nr:hypothetical protein OHA77_38185 [Streptosporangium sp. NBC_01639]